MIGVVEYVRDCDEVVVERPVRRRQEMPVRMEAASCPPPVPPSRPPMPTGPAGWGWEVVSFLGAVLAVWLAWELTKGGTS